MRSIKTPALFTVALIVSVLAVGIIGSVQTFTVNAESGELVLEPTSALAFYGAYLNIRIEPVLVGVEIDVAIDGNGWAKANERSWFSGLSKEIGMLTDEAGSVQLKLFQFFAQEEVTVTIRVMEKVETRTYTLEPLRDRAHVAATYEEVISWGPEQVIPEVPLGPVVAAVSMVAALGIYLRIGKRKLRLIR